MSKITNDGLTRMLYSCTQMTTVGVKGLSTLIVLSYILTYWAIRLGFRVRL